MTRRIPDAFTGRTTFSGTAPPKVWITASVSCPSVRTTACQPSGCRQLSETIKNELRSRNLITDPYVTTEIVNFTYSVLGEAKKVGTVEVKGKDRVTILDAIAQSGDLTQDAKLDRIAVIREENGKRRVHHVDIRSKSIFDSPVFYLKQNDIIYVEPNDNKVREESRRNMQWIFTGASLITTAISLITLFKK